MEYDAYQLNQLEQAGALVKSGENGFDQVSATVQAGGSRQAVLFNLFDSGTTTGVRGHLLISFDQTEEGVTSFTFDPSKKYTMTITEVS